MSEQARPVPRFGRIAGPADWYFVRHGESEGNHERKVQGHTDLPLTDRGRRQAERAGDWLAGAGIGLVVASPLRRAWETAEIIAGRIGVDPARIVASADVQELDTGIFSNKTFAQIEADHAELYREFRSRSWESVPEAERIVQLMARAVRHYDWLVERSNGGAPKILTVTHGGFFQWLFRASFGTPQHAWLPLVHLDNCGLSHFSIEPVPAPDGGGGAFFAEWRKVNFTGFSAV